jgi:hypothetical protein
LVAFEDMEIGATDTISCLHGDWSYQHYLLSPSIGRL